jgi:hypothetical protein
VTSTGSRSAHTTTWRVYRPDISLRLAWGLQVGAEFTIDDWVMPDKKVSRFIADGFWQGALVARWHLLAVDGGRCYLPDAEPMVVKTGEGFFDAQAAGWTARASEVALAQLLNEVTPGMERGRSQFGTYLERLAGIVEVADEQPPATGRGADG